MIKSLKKKKANFERKNKRRKIQILIKVEFLRIIQIILFTLEKDLKLLWLKRRKFRLKNKIEYILILFRCLWISKKACIFSFFKQIWEFAIIKFIRSSKIRKNLLFQILQSINKCMHGCLIISKDKSEIR